MKNKSFIIFTYIIICLLFLLKNTYSQTYSDDSLAVWAILDSNGFDDFLRVEDVTDSSEGRIVKLDLSWVSSPELGLGMPIGIVYTLPAEIGKLTKLKELFLDNNDLTSLPAEIGNLTDLIIFHIDHNRLASIPAEIGNLVNLQTFRIDYNPLKSLPPEFANLSSLRNFNIEFNDLTSLPAEFGNLSNLSNFYIGFNDITSLPKKFGNLTNLSNLYINNNSLTSLPAEFGNLTNLGNLHIDGNSLTSLPPDIGNITNLEYLVVYNNYLDTLPSEIGNLINLEELDLHNNNLIDLPDSIVNLKSLNLLDLDSNQLCSLSVEVKEWADTYDPGWEGTQDCGTYIKLKQCNKSQTETILFNNKNSSINLYIPSSGNIKLDVYDLKGRLIFCLIDSYKQAGKYSLNWDTNKHGSGIYYIQLSSGNNTIIQKAFLAK